MLFNGLKIQLNLSTMLLHRAEVDYVLFDEDDSKRATVVVPDNKLSLAIGRRGQNVRLASLI